MNPPHHATNHPLILVIAMFAAFLTPASADTLPPLTRDRIPHTVPELYAGFDPDKEPLEVRVVKEHEQEGVVVRLLTYTVGTFKGTKSLMGAWYAFPKGARKLPAVLQMHGGGQRAQSETVIAWAKNGYAAMAINWGGRRMDGQPDGEKGTDWGAVDATQTGHNTHYQSCMPDAKTLDDFESPRNNNWFLILLAAKRAVSFLQQQPEVDPARIGATGHSMGGTLTVMLAGSDSRIKAAAPSCGGAGSAPEELRARPGNAARRKNTSKIWADLIDENVYLKHITCPIIYFGPQNDFNGLIDELFMNWPAVPSKTVAYAIAKHLNHRHDLATSFVDVLWFEQHLKGTLTLPHTPAISATLSPQPKVVVTPDRSADVVKVDIFYSQDPNGQFRFYRTADSKRIGGTWQAECSLFSSEMPLFVLANVHYPFPKVKVTGPPWNKNPGKNYLLSTRLLMFESPELVAAKVQATDKVERLVERDFSTLQDWYELEHNNAEARQIVTRKVKDPKWRGPDGATLAVDVQDTRGGSLVLTFEFNSYSQYGGDKSSGDFYAVLPFKASSEWQRLTVRLSDLKPFGPHPRRPQIGDVKLPDNWQTLCMLSITARLNANGQKMGAGRFDDQRKLRNLRWEGGAYPKTILMPGSHVALDPEAYARQFESQIRKSIELGNQEQ